MKSVCFCDSNLKFVKALLFRSFHENEAVFYCLFVERGIAQLKWKIASKNSPFTSIATFLLAIIIQRGIFYSSYQQCTFVVPNMTHAYYCNASTRSCAAN